VNHLKLSVVGVGPQRRNHFEGSFLDRTVGSVRRAGEAKTNAIESGHSGARTSRIWQESIVAREVGTSVERLILKISGLAKLPSPEAT
jgi:hypothetical protein